MTMTDLPTWTEEYRTADRSNWRTGGAWEDEPDKVVADPDGMVEVDAL